MGCGCGKTREEREAEIQARLQARAAAREQRRQQLVDKGVTTLQKK